MKRIFSGIRPSGKLHLGNYLGAIQSWIDLQETHDAIYAVVDLHGLTTPFDPQKRQSEIHDVVLDYLAAGLDPKKSSIVIQSHIREHLELAWILACHTPLSWVDRIPTFKEKKEKHPQNINVGLLSYPVLMAADILLYKSNAVPVGEDQVPHIELTRQIAKRFNAKYGEIFPIPQEILSEGKRIMSLSDPGSKMSKTGGAGIALSDSPDEIRKKIKKAVTATNGDKLADSPGVANLFILMEHFSPKEVYADFMKSFKDGSIRYGDMKEQLATDIIEHLAPFRERRAELEADPAKVSKIISEGELHARTIAEKTLQEVKEAIGLS